MGIDAFFDDVILVEDVAHKVTVIEFVHQLTVDLWRQMLVPFGVVTAQRDIQRQNIFHFIGMYGLITNRRASRRKAMQKRLAAFFRRTGEEIPLGLLEVFRQPALCFFDAIPGHLQQQMMFIFITPGFHPRRQVRREDVTQRDVRGTGRQRHVDLHVIVC